MQEQIMEMLEDIKPGISEEQCDNYVEDGILDSLDIMNLIVALEDGFDISLEPEDVVPENFASVDTIAALVNRYKEGV